MTAKEQSGERFVSDATRLPADDFELHAAATHAIAPCPFCGRHPISTTKQNPTTGLFVVQIICADCFVSMSSCMQTREGARENVIARWSSRTPSTSSDEDGR